MYFQDWDESLEKIPLVTAVDEDDFYEGMKIRHDFMVENNPYLKVKKLTQIDERKNF